MPNQNLSNYKSLPFTVKTIDEETGVFTGHAAAFNNIDDGGDLIPPGAFKKTIEERFDRIKLCWQHDWQDPIGVPRKLSEDSYGLAIDGKISLTTRGKDAITLMRDGVISELSIGYDIIKDSWTEIDGRQVHVLNEIRLYEISLVTIAMNQLAVISSVKGFHLDDPLEKLADYPALDRIEIIHALLKEQENTESPQSQELVTLGVTALQELLAVAEPPDQALTTHEGDTRKRLELKLRYMQSLEV